MYVYTVQFSRHVFGITKTCLFKYTENFATKKWKFSNKNSDIFHTSAQNTDCGYLLELLQLGGSNDYPKSMFFSRNKKNNVYIPQFYYMKMAFKGVKIIQACWFKQYFICSFTCKQIYTSNVPGSDSKLEAYTGHFLEIFREI